MVYQTKRFGLDLLFAFHKNLTLSFYTKKKSDLRSGGMIWSQIVGFQIVIWFQILGFQILKILNPMLIKRPLLIFISPNENVGIGGIV